MYFRNGEHNPPHIHAIYNSDTAAISIHTGDILDGYLPEKALNLVKEWIHLNRRELLIMWETQEFIKVPPL